MNYVSGAIALGVVIIVLLIPPAIARRRRQPGKAFLVGDGLVWARRKLRLVPPPPPEPKPEEQREARHG